MGDNPHALEYYQKVLVIGEEVLGASHPEVATFYDKIGDVHSSMGGLSHALEYYHYSN